MIFNHCYLLNSLHNVCVSAAAKHAVLGCGLTAIGKTTSTPHS